MRCAKHDKDTAVSCGRCEKPVCMQCMVHSDVGVRCGECAPPLQFRRPVLTRAACRQVAGGTGTLLVIMLVIGVVSVVLRAAANDASGGGSSEGYFDDAPGWDYDVRIGKIADPWLPSEGDSLPAAGFRFVAIEVTVAAAPENESAYPTGTYDFQLVDDEQFTYGPLVSGAEPTFPEEVNLGPGEKTHGWVTFEVADRNGIESLTSYEETVYLGDDVATAP